MECDLYKAGRLRAAANSFMQDPGPEGSRNSQQAVINLSSCVNYGFYIQHCFLQQTHKFTCAGEKYSLSHCRIWCVMIHTGFGAGTLEKRTLCDNSKRRWQKDDINFKTHFVCFPHQVSFQH